MPDNKPVLFTHDDDMDKSKAHKIIHYGSSSASTSSASTTATAKSTLITPKAAAWQLFETVKQFNNTIYREGDTLGLSWGDIGAYKSILFEAAKNLNDLLNKTNATKESIENAMLSLQYAFTQISQPKKLSDRTQDIPEWETMMKKPRVKASYNSLQKDFQRVISSLEDQGYKTPEKPHGSKKLG